MRDLRAIFACSSSSPARAAGERPLRCARRFSGQEPHGPFLSPPHLLPLLDPGTNSRDTRPARTLETSLGSETTRPFLL